LSQESGEVDLLDFAALQKPVDCPFYAFLQFPLTSRRQEFAEGRGRKFGKDGVKDFGSFFVKFGFRRCGDGWKRRGVLSALAMST
jgi:hypothetical protein